MIKLSTLKKHPNNPRRMTPSAMEKLKESISRDPEYMVVRPLIVGRKNVILGGNQRYAACMELGKTEIPDTWVKRVKWTEEKENRFVLVDNAPESMAGFWDLDKLADEWKDIEWNDDFEFLDLEFSMPGVDPEDIPGTNKDLDESELEKTNTECPKCGFTWKK